MKTITPQIDYKTEENCNTLKFVIYFKTTIWGCEKVQKFYTEIQRIIANKILGEIKIHSQIMTSLHETQQKGN